MINKILKIRVTRVTLPTLWKSLGVYSPAFNNSQIKDIRRGKKTFKKLWSPLQAFPFPIQTDYLHCYYAGKKKNQDERYFCAQVGCPASGALPDIVNTYPRLNRSFSTDTNALCMGHRKHRGFLDFLVFQATRFPWFSTGNNCILSLLLLKDHIITYQHFFFLITALIILFDSKLSLILKKWAWCVWNIRQH